MSDPCKATRHDALTVWFLAEPQKPRLVGALRLTDNKGVALTYAPVWLENGFALSEDLPLVDTPLRPRQRETAAGAIDDARPDRWGERVIRYICKPPRLSLMEYLYYAGDDRFGALGISISAESYVPRNNGALPRLDDVFAMQDAIEKIRNGAPISTLQQRMLATGGSFGGAKPKALIDIEGVQWVIKFPNGEPVDLALVEHAAMTLAAQAGIRVAETRPIPLEGEHALAIRRFDRVGQQRLHCISAGTALRALAFDENSIDFSYPNLAQLLRRIGDTKDDANKNDMRELFRRMVFNILIDNTDDHEKNHALIMFNPERNGNVRLSPAYDVLPTNSGQGHQEFGVGLDGRDSTLANAMSQCALFGLQPALAAKEIVGVVDVVNGWQAHFRATGVSAADVTQLAEFIDGSELLRQRQKFSAGTYTTIPGKRS